MKEVREPVRVKWIWVVLAVIVLLSVPWYFPEGSIEPVIMGFPYWAFVSLVATVALCLFMAYVIRNWWNVESRLDGVTENNRDGGGRR